MVKARKASSLDVTHYEEIEHPNEEKSNLDETTRYSILVAQGENVGWVHSKFVRWFVNFDENTLRPFFIRKYTIEKQILEDEY